MAKPDDLASSTLEGGTSGSDYSSAYYAGDRLGSHAAYDWETAEWRNFFTHVASRLVAALEPVTSLDVGCAKGLLVQALAGCGVEAEGFDISEDAIADSHSDVRDRLHVGSATEPLTKRYDIISCVEVLEHMAPTDAQRAIDSMCGATDTILFSSSPTDFTESTHINTHQTPEWAAWFAERGFFRRTDLDASFLAPWAIIFSRLDLSKRAIVGRYEALYDPTRRELEEKKSALLATQRRLDQSRVAGHAGVDDDVVLARHAELTARDNVMGLEAEIATMRRQLLGARDRIGRLRRRAEAAESEVRAVRGSRTWRAGRAVTAPLRRFR